MCKEWQFRFEEFALDHPKNLIMKPLRVSLRPRQPKTFPKQIMKPWHVMSLAEKNYGQRFRIIRVMCMRFNCAIQITQVLRTNRPSLKASPTSLGVSTPNHLPRCFLYQIDQGGINLPASAFVDFDAARGFGSLL